MKTIDEVAESLVYPADDGSLPPKQMSHARDLLKKNPRLAEVLRAPLEICQYDAEHFSLEEFPLGQSQPLNARFDMWSGTRKMGVRAVETANAVKTYPNAIVVSTGRGELCVERTLFRTITKLLWSRMKTWWRSLGKGR